jgi:hypothetical protein
MWSALVDLALTPEEQEDNGMVCGGDPDDLPRYPWGMKLSFNKAEIEKLGLPENVSIGDLLDARIFAVVTSISKNQRSDGTDNCCIEIQVQKMAVSDELTDDDDD